MGLFGFWSPIHTVEVQYSLAKCPELSALIGTTSVAHLNDSIDALSMTLPTEDIAHIESAFPDGAAKGVGMRKMRFVDGMVILQAQRIGKRKLIAHKNAEELFLL